MRYFNALHTHASDLYRIVVAPAGTTPRALAGWERGVVAGLVATSLALGLANLGGPSLWHDELVHLYVAKNIAATGWPALPSGDVYPSSLAYNYVLALFVALLGDSEFAARLPSVLLGACNTALVYFLCRGWLGRPAAVAAAFFFVTSPWQVAWARQARLYEFQMTGYLLLLLFGWRYFSGEPQAALRRGLAAAGAYLAGILTSFHSILFLGPVGAFAIGLVPWAGRRDLRWAWAVAGCTALGLLTVLCFWLNPNPVDRAAVFETGLGGALVDHVRADRYYYFRFLANNLSAGFFLLALFGTAALALRGEKKDVWVLLAFWVPVLILTWLVGYRRFRFMFFAYPLYIMIYAHGLVVLWALLRSYRRSLLHGVCAALILLFVGRLALSTVALARDSLETASGAGTTLAVVHQAWREAGAWVKEHRTDEAILTTTFLPVYHYVGHVDNWFPNRYTRWERQESGLEGLASLEELKAFLKEHPRGYFLAEHSRFMDWKRHGDLEDVLGGEYHWVNAHMTLIDAACADQVNVWRWDFTEGVPE